MEKVSSQEARGHRLYTKGRYEDALRAYYRAIGHKPDPSVTLFLCAYRCLYEVHRKRGLAGGNRKQREEYERHLERSLALLGQGVSLYPNDIRLQRYFALELSETDEADKFLQATREFVRLAEEICKEDVEEILSRALFLGDLEVCQQALPKFLKKNEPYRRLPQGDNQLAEILSVFGPAICPRTVIEDLVADWDVWGFWYSAPEDRNIVRAMSHMALLRREDVRNWALTLPSFNCSYLDGLALLLQIMVRYFNQEIEVVRGLLAENLNKEDNYPEVNSWLLAIGKELAMGLPDSEEFKEFSQDFEQLLAEDLKFDEKVFEECGRQKEKNKAEYQSFLRNLIKGEYDGAEILKEIASVRSGPRQDFSVWKEVWYKVMVCLQKENPEGAISLLRGFIRRQDEKWREYLYPEREVLFGLLYSVESFTEAHFVAKEIQEYDSLESHIFSKEVAQMLAFEIKDKGGDQERLARQRERAREQALESIGLLKAYLQQHPNETREIVREYAKDWRRSREVREISNFVYYLFLRGSECLGKMDVDEGIKEIVGLVTLPRSNIRSNLPKEQFQRAWQIISVLRRIERIIGQGSLKEGFEDSLDSDKEFVEIVSQALVEQGWEKDENLLKAYQEFVLWIVLEKLGFSSYSHLFRPAPQTPRKKEKEKRKKRKRKKREGRGVGRAVELEAGGEIEALKPLPSFEKWTFFVLTGPEGSAQPIEPLPETFNAYFKNILEVKGEDILSKLQYILMYEPYERQRFPRLEVLYQGFRKSKRGGVRIFWQIDEKKQELRFFVKNRKEAYR